MKKKNYKTAEALMAELEGDAEYVSRRAELDKKFHDLAQKYARLEAPIVQQLAAIGCRADSIQDAVSKYAPFSVTAVQVLLASLEISDDDRVRESLVRALAAASEPFDGGSLARCYEKTSDESLRWAIANTIALVRPHSIDEWLSRTCGKDGGFARTLRDLANDR